MVEIIKLHARRKLFEFTSFQNWMDTAQRKFYQSGYTTIGTLCIDAFGRACISGKEFKRAADESAYPVTVYALVGYEI